MSSPKLRPMSMRNKENKVNNNPGFSRAKTIAITNKLHDRNKSISFCTNKNDGHDISEPTSPTKIIRDKLSNLATSFQGFEQTVNQNKKRHEKQNETRIIDVKKDISRVNKLIQIECKTRDDMIKTTTHNYEMKIKKVKSFIEIPINKKISAITESIEYLSNKIDEIERKESLENDKFSSMINNSYDRLMKKFQEYENEFESHCLQYNEKQNVLKQIINDQQNKIKRFIQNEQDERNKKVHKISMEIEKEINERNKNNQQIKQYLVNNIDKLNARISESEKERVETTEQVVKALCHYTTALQDGVQIVSSTNN